MTPAPSAHPGEPLPEGVVSTGAGDALVICHGLGELSRRAADYLVRCLHENVAARGTAVMVLAGGSTPQPVYQAMASADLPWERIWFIPSDERLVGEEDARSNGRMLRQCLGSRARLVSMIPAGWRPEDGGEADLAERMEFRLGELASQRRCGVPVLDVVLLGLGTDGHVASLFPGSPVLEEKDRWVSLAPGPSRPGRSPQVRRLTLTLPVFNAARRLVFLVSGRGKAAAVEAVLSGSLFCPAAMIAHRARRSVWFLDEEAAAGLHPGG